MTTKWIKRGSHPLRPRTRRLDLHLITDWKDEPKPFVWHKTADEILDRLAAYGQRINH